MTTPLPDRPDLDQLRKQAKDLIKAHRRGDTKVCKLLRNLPRFANAADAEILKGRLLLSEAQHALAREHGFKNWAALARHVRESGGMRATGSIGWSVREVRPGTPMGISSGRGRCELCKKEATLHVTDLKDGQKTERHLCEEHAVQTIIRLKDGRRIRLIPYPTKYYVTLEATREQIDREEKVSVTLPDGRVIQIGLQKGWGKPGEPFGLVRWPDPGPSAKYSVAVGLKIIRPSQPA